VAPAPAPASSSSRTLHLPARPRHRAAAPWIHGAGEARAVKLPAMASRKSRSRAPPTCCLFSQRLPPLAPSTQQTSEVLDAGLFPPCVPCRRSRSSSLPQRRPSAASPLSPLVTGPSALCVHGTSLVRAHAAVEHLPAISLPWPSTAAMAPNPSSPACPHFFHGKPVGSPIPSAPMVSLSMVGALRSASARLPLPAAQRPATKFSLQPHQIDAS
jgi:hypothetical protein